jgi:hypothetical protein
MYSRKTREEYGDYVITPPPGYDGSRFGSRSDGRDDSFPPYDNQGQIYSPPIKKKDEQEKREENKSGSLFPFLKKGIGQEELLLIALLIVLVGEKDVSPEIVLILALLLCI